MISLITIPVRRLEGPSDSGRKVANTGVPPIRIQAHNSRVAPRKAALVWFTTVVCVDQTPDVEPGSRIGRGFGSAGENDSDALWSPRVTPQAYLFSRSPGSGATVAKVAI